MKRVMFVLSIVILLIASISMAGAPGNVRVPSRSVIRPTQQGELMMELAYDNFNYRPIYILFELDTGRVIMMIPLDKNSFGLGDSELTYMANIVQEMVSSRQPVRLSNGYSIEFGHGLPIWGPHKEIGRGYEYECLLFAEGLTIHDKRIVVHGIAEEQRYDDGYKEWFREH